MSERTIKLIDIAADVNVETEKAYLLNDGTRTAWAPKSIVENNKDGTFTMPEWFAMDRGFI